jgi:hypothetical protein
LLPGVVAGIDPVNRPVFTFRSALRIRNLLTVAFGLFGMQFSW